MTTKKITIFGATGTSAGGAMREFLKAGWDVKAVTRDVSSEKAQAAAALGATLVTADLQDRATIRAAIEGADTVYFSGASLGNALDIGQAVEGINVADAVAEVGVGHYIYQSALVQSSARGYLSLGSKRAIEERIAELALPATITRPSLFMDNFLTYFPVQESEGALQIAMALPADKPQGMVCAEDIGRAALAVASAPEQYIGQDIDLIADTVTFSGMAKIIAEAAGKPCNAFTVPFEALEEHWPQGVGLYKWLSTDTADYDAAALGQLIGKPIDFCAWVERYLKPTL